MRPIVIKCPQAQGECVVIPAVHFSHVFALEVNRLCSSPQTRPEAIAVELGPQSALAARSWLEELGVNGDAGKSLPVMLGLLKRNNLLPGSLRQKVFELQRETGLDLSEMSPELLLEELNFFGYSLLSLSPTDSIIEAVRCSIELRIPLYGVDLEDVPAVRYRPVLIQDPLSAEGNFKTYVDLVGSQTVNNRNPEVDPKREMVMASRLKGLMNQYRRILFTGGLGHSVNLQKLVTEDTLRASSVTIQNPLDGDPFEKVIVHPLMAVSFMDRFPELVTAYEKVRKPVRYNEADPELTKSIVVEEIFEKLLNKTYGSYFLTKRKNNRTGIWWRDLMGLQSFEDHLMKYCLLSHHLVPDIGSTISTARAMMSPDFVKKITGVFFGFPWVKPEDYPDYSMVAPHSVEGRRETSVRLFSKGRDRGKKFFMRSVIGGVQYANELEICFQWGNKSEEGNYQNISHTWRPWDFLISSLSIRALELTQGRYFINKTEPFEYTLMEGIDLKSTLRSYSRGEDTLFVFDRTPKTHMPDFHPCEGFPVVWIIEPGNHEGARFNALYEDCYWMVKYVEDKESLKLVIRQRGHKMIALIGYGHFNVFTQASQKSKGIRSDRYQGVLLYQPIHFDKRQFAHWVEWSRYARNPYCNGCEIDSRFPYGLAALFNRKIGLSLNNLRWETALVLFALPFAQDRITVVAPKKYQMEPIVYKKAREFGVELTRVPLELFKPEELEKMRINHMASAKNYDPECIFDESIEKAIEELQTANRDLVPPKWREFGLRKG